MTKALVADAASWWKPGRGRLGPLAPLLGTWHAAGDSPRGPYECTRTFTRILGGAFLQLDVEWRIGGGTYVEQALFGPDAERGLRFWSFTSDGKHSTGTSAGSEDLPAPAVVFEAVMPAGRARTAYWPSGPDAMTFVVEAAVRGTWARFTEHHYTR